MFLEGIGCEGDNHADTEVSEEGVGEACQRSHSPLACGRSQAETLPPREINSGIEPHLQPVEEPVPEQVTANEEDYGSEGRPC